MDFHAWLAAAGALLLVMALTAAWLRRLPVTSSVVYLALGVALSPAWLGLVAVDFIGESRMLERLTEIAVIVSLFVGGLKLRLPLAAKPWRAAYRLTGPVMVLSILGVAAAAHWGLGLGWAAAFLLGSVLAPTDPVLAGMVAVNDAADDDRLRYGLSGEAGFNDGAAFPFVVFGLLWLEHGEVGGWAGVWAMHRLVWAVPAGLAIGYVLGIGVGRFAIHVRSRWAGTAAPGDFLAMALILLSYTGAEAVGAWGFLAAFAAGLGFRKAELATAQAHPLPGAAHHRGAARAVVHPPAEQMVGPRASPDDSRHPTTAAGHVVAEIVTFGDTAERIAEVLTVILLGACLAAYWEPRWLLLGGVLFLLIRPLAVCVCLVKTPTNRLQRTLMAWFGIRGIGSLYYLSYALNHGLSGASADPVVAATLTVTGMSIVAHGITSPWLDRYERHCASRRRVPAANP